MYPGRGTQFPDNSLGITKGAERFWSSVRLYSQGKGVSSEDDIVASIATSQADPCCFDTRPWQRNTVACRNLVACSLPPSPGCAVQWARRVQHEDGALGGGGPRPAGSCTAMHRTGHVPKATHGGHTRSALWVWANEGYWRLMEALWRLLARRRLACMRLVRALRRFTTLAVMGTCTKLCPGHVT